MKALKKVSFVFALGLMAVLVSAQQDFEWQTLGEETYAAQCVSCHQQSGEGVEGVYPTLVGSELLTGDPAQVIDLLLNGKAAMPAYSNVLNDEQIAAVLSHERNSWGNEASVITPDMVAAQRSGDDSAGANETGGATTGGSETGGSTGGDATGGTAMDSAATGGSTGGAMDSDSTATGGESTGGAATGGAAATQMATVELPEGWHDQAAQLYTDNCAACHQAEGQGVEGVFPALAGSAYAMSDQATLISLILHGRGGMPSFEGGLSSEEIAYVLSHVRTAWGNEASLISPEMVEDVAQGRLTPGGADDPNDRPGAAN